MNTQQDPKPPEGAANSDATDPRLDAVAGDEARPHQIGDADVIAAMRRWLERAVIGLNLCPFAKSVYVRNQVRIVVSEARNAEDWFAEFEHEVELLLATDAAEVDTTLLVHPKLLRDFMDFNEFVSIAEDRLGELELDGVLQVASFHPRFQFEGTAPDEIGNYTNRAPFPTLHLLREASLDRAIESMPDTDEIWKRNVATMDSLGYDGWNALWNDDPEGAH
ncbi:DUF1415 domain-containing protein [Derxia lacustris]|uniref:DUF1415 domain-containing protein n=1 Tax=Derxia lacustris TaxID=764842 RepID=UPI001C382280|nr:DUF1415 domain-containing protein [Derxia lacustris]